MRHAVNDEAADRGPVAGAAVRVQRVVDPFLGFEQLANPPVMCCGVGRATALLQAGIEVGAQHFVIAVRAALIDGDREQLVVLEVFEHRARVGSAGDLVAQRTRQHRQRRRLDEERLQVGGQAGQHVASQVVAADSSGAELADQPPPSVERLIARRQVVELQPGGPTLGASDQHRHVGWGRGSCRSDHGTADRPPTFESADRRR